MIGVYSGVREWKIRIFQRGITKRNGKVNGCKESNWSSKRVSNCREESKSSSDGRESPAKEPSGRYELRVVGKIRS